MQAENMPLQGLRVLEFTHMVMGPTVGLILADLGADVTRIEPLGGDHTRKLRGSGAGYFPMYNRNKRSVCVDLKNPRGVAVATRLADAADIVIENFRPGTLARLGLGYEVLQERNPRILYCSAKGFLTGPFENRTALDEVAQMMGGLAYMTGPPGRPLRAGASVIDVTGGMFGVIGILSALERRHRTGQGAHITCSLFETTSFLVGQHMAQMAVTGTAAAPMPARISAWAIYDVFEVADGGQIFVAVVSDAQWRAFCSEFALTDLSEDPSLLTNNARVAARERILPRIRAVLSSFSRDDLLRRLEGVGVPASVIARPEDLFDDEHLNACGGLVHVTLPDGRTVKLPALPVEMDGERFGVRRSPARAGEHSHDALGEVGMTHEEIDSLIEANVVG